MATELGGRPVEVVQLDDDALTARMVGAGIPEPAARVIASFPAAARAGLLGSVSSAVEDLTGARPTALRDVVVERLADTPGA